MKETKETKKVYPQFVQFQPTKNELTITWGVNTLYKERKSHGGFSCFIPGFDMYFSAKDTKQVDQKTEAIMGIYFEHFIEHIKKNGLKKLALDLHKSGFKATNDASAIQKMLNNIPIKAKFKKETSILPREFEHAKEKHFESNLAVSI